MNFSVYNYLPIGKVYVGAPKGNVVSRPIGTRFDKVSINSELGRYLDKSTLEAMVNSNPVIASIMKKHGIKPNINAENFKRTTLKHSIDTQNTAAQIYRFLPQELKDKANINHIRKGAILHDIGKVLIPEKVLNKNGRLTEEEMNIMRQHSKLGEELLVSQNIEPDVLNIVKYHHQNRTNQGYPKINRGGFDINTEIVSLADKYSALTEKRSYKQATTPVEALNIIKRDVEKGNFSIDVYNALVKAATGKL